MYRVTLYDNPNEQDGIVIHSPNVNDLKVNGIINDEINKIDSFNLTLYPNNPSYGKIKSFLNVLNTKNNQLEFKGRVYAPADDIDAQGVVKASYLCQRELSYLHDSQQRHLKFRGTTKEAFATMINYHNTQVEDYKHFQVGNVEIQDPNDYMYFYLSAETTTLDSLFEKLIDKLGDELQIRYENEVRFLDCPERSGYDSETEIHLKKNLKNISRDVDTSEIVTKLTPLGERIEGENIEATDASKKRLTIESINNGCLI